MYLQKEKLPPRFQILCRIQADIMLWMLNTIIGEVMLARSSESESSGNEISESSEIVSLRSYCPIL